MKWISHAHAHKFTNTVTHSLVRSLTRTHACTIHKQTHTREKKKKWKILSRKLNAQQSKQFSINLVLSSSSSPLPSSSLLLLYFPNNINAFDSTTGIDVDDRHIDTKLFENIYCQINRKMQPAQKSIVKNKMYFTIYLATYLNEKYYILCMHLKTNVIGKAMYTTSVWFSSLFFKLSSHVHDENIFFFLLSFIYTTMCIWMYTATIFIITLYDHGERNVFFSSLHLQMENENNKTFNFHTKFYIRWSPFYTFPSYYSSNSLFFL